MTSVPINSKQSIGQPRCIALFPGAFRPPHEAHLAAVSQLARRPDVDEVVILIANRNRTLPGTTLALDAKVAQAIWLIYLETVANRDKVRIEIAEHSAIAHALSYFERVRRVDRLLFCVGESDLGQGDERFDQLAVLSERTGIAASVVPAATASLPVRATDLRQALADGEAGYEHFIAGLPPTLNQRQRAQVWTLCQQGLREMSELVAEKLQVILPTMPPVNNRAITDLRCLNPHKLDSVFRLQSVGGPSCTPPSIVKYAGDTVEAGSFGQPDKPKPRNRLATERRAIKCLRTHLPPSLLQDVELPEVLHFDKERQTLIMSEVCVGGKTLQAALQAGIFNLHHAAAASRFLAACHQLAGQVPPLWGEIETDQRHWQAMLALRTTELATAIQKRLVQRDLSGAPTKFSHVDRFPMGAPDRSFQDDLRYLHDASLQATLQDQVSRFFHLDFSTKNILVTSYKIGVIDFEQSASVGDPAYDFGLFLADFMVWGLYGWGVYHGADQACLAAIQEAITVYQATCPTVWQSMGGRLPAFVGASLLYMLVCQQGTMLQRCKPLLFQTATALLSMRSVECEETPQILAAAASGVFCPVSFARLRANETDEAPLHTE